MRKDFAEEVTQKIIVRKFFIRQRAFARTAGFEKRELLMGSHSQRLARLASRDSHKAELAPEKRPLEKR